MQTLDVISVNLWQILISLINLFLLFLMFKKFLFKPVQNILAKRQKELDDQYDAAKDAQLKADENRQAWEDKLALADSQADAILQSATENAKYRGDKMVAEAKERAAGIIRAAETEAELERQKAADGIKREIVEVSGVLTEKLRFTALSTISLSVLIAHLLLEFLVPLWLKNGQTFGKKAFGIGLMRKDGVMISPFALFVRSILGKATIEVLLPLLLVFMMFMGIAGVLIYLVLALVIAQVMLLLMHPNRCVLHDLMGCTIAVDISSQMIFRSPEALIAYQKERAAEKAEKASY